MEMYRCVEHYVSTGELEPELIEPSILIVSDKTKTAEPFYLEEHDAYEAYSEADQEKFIKLIIPAKATQAELIDFIKRHNLDIQRKLDEISTEPRKRLRARPKERRNQDILRWSNEGLTNAQIAKKVEHEYPEDSLAVTTQDIRGILSRMRTK